MAARKRKVSAVPASLGNRRDPGGGTTNRARVKGYFCQVCFKLSYIVTNFLLWGLI